MKKVMFSVDEVKVRILRGDKLILSGDEQALRALPAGTWIGGTTPYFMAEAGGLFTQEQIYVTPLDDDMEVDAIRVYDDSSIAKIYSDVPENGFALVIISAFTQTHAAFALNAPKYQDFAAKPVVGWISGVALENLGEITPKVFDGRSQQVIENGAVAIHVQLPANKAAEIDILNIFAPGDGDVITFPQDGCEIRDAFVNGERVDFARYVTDNHLDIRLPLVVDSAGAMINISFNSVEADKGVVKLFAPVFKGFEYKHAKPVADYVKEFARQMPSAGDDKIFFSCNCILNFLHSELAGKQTGAFTGPVTFGEVAYQLLNQTLVYLKIHELG